MSIPITEAKKYSDDGESVVYMPEQILSKKATEYKNNKSYDLAIACLKKVNELYPHSFYAYTRDNYERLVDMMILAWRFEDAKVEVLLENEDVCLNTEALAALFNVKRPAITKHIKNIYEDEELEERSTCSKMEHMGNDGKQTYNTKYYNLDMIISIGFRVNSKKSIKFRTWANKIIKEYMIQGFSLNDERFLKAQKSDQEYFKRLLNRIKLIRTSERMFYQKITDIFAEWNKTNWK